MYDIPLSQIIQHIWERATHYDKQGKPGVNISMHTKEIGQWKVVEYWHILGSTSKFWIYKPEVKNNSTGLEGEKHCHPCLYDDQWETLVKSGGSNVMRIAESKEVHVLVEVNDGSIQKLHD